MLDHRSNFDGEVYVLDVGTGDAQQVTDDDRVRYTGIELTPDGDAFHFEDEGHGFSKRKNRIEAYVAVAEFFDEHLGPVPTVD
jgi:dipeptidyl aminopeptidase/acylaminoacyl peptidase